MEVFTFLHNILNIFIYAAELLCNIYCKDHKLDPEKFTNVFKFGSLTLMLINTIVFIAFNYPAIVLQFPQLFKG